MFGYIPDHESDNDPRNLYWQDFAPLGATEEKLPERVLLDNDVRNLNQGQTSACTCHALVHAFSLMEKLQLSARYAFWKVKTDKKYRSSDLHYGAYIIDPIKLLINEGIPAYSVLYDEKDITSDEKYIKALTTYPELFKGGAYLYVTSGNDQREKWQQVTRYIAYEQKPVIVGVTWRTSFNNARKTGVVPPVTPTGSLVGHAMLVNGYEWRVVQGAVELYVRCENSFGDSWGDKGSVWLPTRYTQLQSGIAYIPPDEVERIGLVKPEPVEARDVLREKLAADEIWKAVDAAFPLNVSVLATAKNNAARSLYAKNKLLFIQAATYRKWKTTDIVNWLYARSRGKTETKAFNLDFSKERSV